ncbi:MAG: hypothetical protein M1826_002894 [Phylliscum demangeonii]|nr:MAG: hypothetical protein M1826_002894 [Phylliscum demangeonii]
MASSHSNGGRPATGKIAVVTGVNGYIASVLGHHLLSQGYRVRGTVRSRTSGQVLADGAYRPFGSRFEIVQVPDMTAPHAFDEAVKGEWNGRRAGRAHQIYHVASPVNFNLVKVEEVLDVAVAATKGVLQTAHDCAGAQLEAVVVTSSGAAIMNAPQQTPPVPYVFTEADWNNTSESFVKQAGSPADGALLYFASKAAAEKAVWKWREEHKPSFSISTVCPSVVLGPPVQLPATADGINSALQPTWAIFSGANRTLEDALPIAACVDVRDVCAIHAWCGEHPAESDGQRYIASAGYCTAQATADILRKHFPARRAVIAEGHPGQGYPPDFSQPRDGYGVDGAKAARAVGLQYIAVEKMVVDSATAMEKYL